MGRLGLPAGGDDGVAWRRSGECGVDGFLFSFSFLSWILSSEWTRGPGLTRVNIFPKS